MTPTRRELIPQMRSRICELHSIGWGYKKIHSKHLGVPISTIRDTIKIRDMSLSHLQAGHGSNGVMVYC